MEHWWTNTDRGKTCPSVNWSTAEPLGLNPGVRGNRSATNCVRHGTA
jgi:hypothetical protein